MTLLILLSPTVTIHAHGDLEVRIAELSRRILTNSTDASLFIERAELHRLHQNWSSATADLDRATSLNSNLARVKLARARLFTDTDRLRDALEGYDHYLKQAPTDGVAWTEQARVRVKLEEWEPAFADYTRAVELLSEPLPEYFIERAEVAVRCGKLDLAILGLDEGLKRLGVIVTLQSKAIELELERKDFNAALGRLDMIIARANRKELWLEKRGGILRQAGREAEAYAAFDEALQALNRLPGRLQTTEQMQALSARVKLALGELTKTNQPARQPGGPKK